jgi:L-fuconolactonase
LRLDSHQHFTHEYLPSLLFPILKRNRFDATIAVTKLETVEDTRWLLEQSAQHDFIAGVVGWADPADPGLPGLLDDYQRYPKFRGLVCSSPANPPAGLAELDRRGLSLDLHPHLAAVPQIAERYPGLRIVIDHLGRPSLAAAPFEQWARALEEAARAPNVYGKISGLSSDAPSRWRAEEFQPHVRHALRVFGPARLMFGSDWPSYLPVGTWKEALAAFTQAIGAQTLETREQLLGATAARFYRIATGSAA